MLFFHFFIASKYIMIKQVYLLHRLAELIERLRQPEKRQQSTFPALYREFVAINHHLAYQCAEINGYNSFWSVYLSAQVL